MLENVKSNSVFHEGAAEQNEQLEEETSKLIEQTVPKKRNILSEAEANKATDADTTQVKTRITELLEVQKNQNNMGVGNENRSHSLFFIPMATAAKSIFHRCEPSGCKHPDTEF